MKRKKYEGNAVSLEVLRKECLSNAQTGKLDKACSSFVSTFVHFKTIQCQKPQVSQFDIT